MVEQLVDEYSKACRRTLDELVEEHSTNLRTSGRRVVDEVIVDDWSTNLLVNYRRIIDE